MSKIFALLAVLLIATGVLVLAVPREGPRGPAPEAFSRTAPKDAGNLMAWARDIAEQANAPLSIVFGLISLYYSRRTYNINRERLGAKSGTSA